METALAGAGTIIEMAGDAEDLADTFAVDARAPGTNTRATILVCDDHADIVEMLVSILDLEGYEVVSAYCGSEALDVVRQRRDIDLVLLDKAMPDVDGFDVCRQIKEMFRQRFLPVIMVTAKAHKEDRLAGLNLGADDYITKPFDVEELLAKVRVMLRIKGVEDQLLRRNVELASFNAVASVIGRSLILDEMLHESLAEILRLMHLPCGWIFLRDEEEDRLRLASYQGVEEQTARALAAGGLACPPDSAATTNHDCSWVDAAFRTRHDLRACVHIPLKAKGRVLGMMALASQHEDAFRPHGSDRQVLESLGVELGIAIEHALLYRDAQHRVERLREIDRLKSQFISTASHEFRTPLSIMKGFANLLARKEVFGFDLATEKQYLGLIDDQINALAGLVEDVLDASRIESGHVALRPHDLDMAALIERIAMPIAQGVRDRGITYAITVEPGLRAYADTRHVEQIMSNLLSNAAKYSDDGKTIAVHAYSAGGEARVDVTDQGVGIAPDQLPRLFGRFTRLENRRSVEAGGTGLGLYIAKNWVEANGGRIWADSAPEAGSTFSFTLPLTSRQQAAANP